MSRIEQLINEIETYIDSCKFQPLSSTKIVVNKEEMEALLVELRLRVPEEISKYQKIISRQEAIIEDANKQAEAILNDAKAQAADMVSEHSIMEQAYTQGAELVEQAQAHAETVVNNAINDSNNIRLGAVKYTDDMLGSLENIVKHSMDEAQSRYESLLASLRNSYEIVSKNKSELNSVYSGNVSSDGANSSSEEEIDIPEN